MGNDNIEIMGENKEKRKVPGLVILIFWLVSALASSYFIYNILLLDGIENLLRFVTIIVLLIIDIILFVKTCNILKNKKPKKKKKASRRIGILILMILYSIICISCGYFINYVYGRINTVNKKTITYSSSLIVLKDNKANSVKDIKNYKIAILKDSKSPEGYIIPQEILKENKLHDNNDIIDYDSYTEMITDLYSNDVDAIFLSSEYASIYSSIPGYEGIGSDTKIIISKEKEMDKAKTSKIETTSAGKSVTEPFTILLMGVDSTDEILTKNTFANGDSLMLITFNPKTLNATMLSIPRDSYVPIACWPGKKENKITHAAAYGTDCMINTIENFFDVKIDYYAKINFKGLVKLVDAMGGIDVEVPKDLCTDNSNREVEVCIKEGWQHLDGEGALVLSRNRKQLVNGDFGRGQNQQLVIQAMLQKVKTINNVSQFTKIFETISNSLDTNLTTKQILSFYGIANDIVRTGLSSDSSNIVSIDQLYLQGQSAMIYDSGMRMLLYNYIPNTHSRDDIEKAMKTNLEILDHKEAKSFTFSINKEYQKTIIGEGPYRSTFDSSKYQTTIPEEKSTKSIEEDDKKVKTGCLDKDYKEYDPTATKSDSSMCKTKKTTTEEENTVNDDTTSVPAKEVQPKEDDSTTEEKDSDNGGSSDNNSSNDENEE